MSTWILRTATLPFKDFLALNSAAVGGTFDLSVLNGSLAIDSMFGSLSDDNLVLSAAGAGGDISVGVAGGIAAESFNLRTAGWDDRRRRQHNRFVGRERFDFFISRRGHRRDDSADHLSDKPSGHRSGNDDDRRRFTDFDRRRSAGRCDDRRWNDERRRDSRRRWARHHFRQHDERHLDVGRPPTPAICDLSVRPRNTQTGASLADVGGAILTTARLTSIQRAANGTVSLAAASLGQSAQRLAD